MENFIVNGEDKPVYVPEVQLLVAESSATITGESYMEEPFQLYQQILDWCGEFCKSEAKPLSVNFKLSYVNSSSFRALLDTLKGIKDLQDQGHEITINWHHPEDDVNDIQEEGEDLAFDAEIDVNFIPY